MAVGFVSGCCGIAYAYWYAQIESDVFRDSYFEVYVFRLIHTFLVGTFNVAVVLYFLLGNRDLIRMVNERRAAITMFALLAVLHMIPLLFVNPKVLFTRGTMLFVISTCVAVALANRRAVRPDR